MTRSKARESLMQLLYSMEAQKEYNERTLEKFIELNELKLSEQEDYFKKTAAAFIQNRNCIDETIEAASDKWHIARIAKVDLAILRLTVSEIKFSGENAVPESVAINEAVNLAKKYSSEDSGRFINGILGRISRNK